MLVIYWANRLPAVCCFGRIFRRHKEDSGLLKLVKMKLGKNMSDDRAAKICLVAAIVVLLVGVFLFIYGGVAAKSVRLQFE